MGIDYLDKFKGTLFGVAIGDTLGRPFEGLIRMRVHSQFTDFKEFIKSNKKLFYTYTDDTQLTLHTAQALIDGWGFKTDYLIREYIKWLDDPPIGPGFGCKSSIEKLKYGIDWKEAASKSGGNGTAMRVAPIALFYCKDPKALEHAAIQSSVITHSHPAASAGALVTASSQAGVKSPFFIEEYLGKAFVHPYAISTVACAIFIFLKHTSSFEDCIYELATAGGDSDTVAAIGGSLAGSYFGLKKMPVKLINLTKESQKTIEISEELFKRFKKKYV
ncbi:MAG: ADP-ribosylglycohydrolase family protein [Candidatus Lokiarchaeota archaeon]